MIFNPNYWYFFRVLELLNIHRPKQMFCQLLVKNFHKGYMSVLLFCCCSSNVLCLSNNSDSLSHWNSFGYYNTPLFLHISSNTNATSLSFMVVRVLETLYLDVTSTPVNMYEFSSKTLWGTMCISNWCCSLGFVT